MLDVGVLITSTDGRERAAAIEDQARRQLDAAELFDQSGRFWVERARVAPFRVGDGELRMFPVIAGGSLLARLVVHSPERQLSDSDRQALERAATVAALFITRQLAVTAVEGKYRGDFLREVFGGRGGNDEWIVEHAVGLGWDLDRPLVVVMGELDPPSEQEARSPHGSGVAGRSGSPPPGGRSSRRSTPRSPWPTSPPRWWRWSPRGA